MNNAQYDKSSIASIYNFAKRLVGKSLGDVLASIETEVNVRDRGNVGTLVEKFYFNHRPPNDHEPDFPLANLELKTTGVIRRNDRYRAKERLVLSMIDYESIIKEEWETSALLHKCDLMLILVYEYANQVADRRFVLNPLLCSFSGPSSRQAQDKEAILELEALIIAEDELAQVKRDWEFIREKIRAGKAHELSEGDTFFLGACRKGSGGEGESLRRQPNSAISAKSRAFSLKQGYLNKLIDDHVNRIQGQNPREEKLDNGRALIPDHESELGVGKDNSLEQATSQKFAEFIGKSLDEISKEIGYFRTSPNQKGFKRNLAVRVLARGQSSVRELEMADIELKTISLDKRGRPKESMSFPTFHYLEIVNQEWEDSSFFEKLERKFLFIVFREDDSGNERLQRVFYWNMPYQDRREAQRVWEETKRRVAIDARTLPRSSESSVAHVRPKARNGRDTELTPQGEMLVKKCFWLNQGYIQDVILKSE
jgi:DNA mismatch repair protein MutH